MKLLIFAGTSEGRELASFVSLHGLSAMVCVATEYGEMVLPSLPHIQVQRGRLNEAQMRGLMNVDTLVIDATHPYAKEVTNNICAACAGTGAEYIRLYRPPVLSNQPMVTVPDTAAATAYLNTVTGSALLTTGSKELEAYTHVARYAERLWPRVLPTASVLQKCESLGFPGAHIIAMQGPFSKELNVALLRQTNAKYLVTKDTGEAGGFPEKLKAAQEAGATVIRIARPNEVCGYSLDEVCAMLEKRFGLEPHRQVHSRFPLFVSLRGKQCVVVGAGRIAARRIAVLKRFGAQVRVIAPEVCGKITQDSTTTLISRKYRREDIQDAFLVIAATAQREINHGIAEDCRMAGILCSVADNALESTFFFPAICEGGNLVAGVVSDGRAHAATARVAARIREILAEEVIHGTD